MAKHEVEVVSLDFLAAGVGCNSCGGVAGVNDEVSDDLVEDADGLRERFLGEPRRRSGVSVGVEHMAHWCLSALSVVLWSRRKEELQHRCSSAV